MINNAFKEVIELSWPGLIVLLSIIILLRLTYILRSEKKFRFHEELIDLIFVSYLLILFQLVTSQDISGGGTNLMPFREILRYDIGTDSFYKQVVGNILLFVPFGYFASKYCRIKKLGTITIVMLLSSIIIEVVQHFIGRSFDIDDIILNLTGGIIGYLLYIGLNAIKNHIPQMFRKDWFANIISLILLVVVILYMFKIF